MFLQDSGVHDRRFVQLWKLKVPLKVKIFVWLVLRRRVLTVDNLLKRGWYGDTTCVLCSRQTETGDHLFAGCDVSKDILESLLANKKEIRHYRTINALWGASKAKTGALGRRELVTVITTWWFIWLERNQRRFEGKKRDVGNLLATIRATRSIWNSFRRS